MANVQLVRQRQTQVMTTINEVQSIQLVQTMLHGALSTLTYLRELFPEKAFVSRYYEMRETPLQYEDFAAARMPSRQNEADVHSTVLPILQRHRSKRADIFLDWLEKAVFPELESGELRAVQLFIHPDKENRNSVLETYTFTFHYANRGNGRRTPSGLAVDSSGNVASTIKATNTALQQLLRTVSSLCEDLPELPATRLLSMELVYYHEDGKDKNVDGFVPSDEKDLSFQRAKGWHNQTRSLGYPTGYHDTRLRITGLQNDETSQTRQDQELSSNTRLSSNTVSRYNDVSSMPPPPFKRDMPQVSHDTFSKRRSRDSERNNSPITPRNDIDEYESQRSLVNSMNSDLKNMMQSEHITQGDTQTQGTFKKSVFEDAVTVTPTSVRTSNVQTPINTSTFLLSMETQQELSARKSYLKQTATALSKSVGGRSASGQPMLCQCGLGKEEGEMVQCSVCFTWQHLHCYGYTGAKDPRLPDEHVCYWCLLGDTDEKRYKALQTLATKRRAMFHVARNGLRTQTDLGVALGIEHDIAVEMHALVKKSRFIVAAAKSKKPGYRATGKALFVPVQDGPSIRRLLETYFDPMTHIGHRYNDGATAEPKESDVQTNVRLIRDLATDSLPPAASRSRSKLKSTIASDDDDLSSTQHTPTPSKFDMKASQAFDATSEILQETPAMETRSHTRGKKRGAEDEVTDPNDGKRFATPATSRQRFTSFRSKRMIEANDRSSPYLPKSVDR